MTDVDGGVPGLDASVPADAGAERDASTGERDASAPADAGSDFDAGTPPPSSGGCASAGSGRTSFGWIALGLVVVAGLRRRRASDG